MPMRDERKTESTKDEIWTLVRVPISTVADPVRERNGINYPLAGFKIDGDHLVLSFSTNPSASEAPHHASTPAGAQSPTNTKWLVTGKQAVEA